MSKYDFRYEKGVIGRLIGYYRKHDSRILDDILWDKGNYYKKYCLECSKCTNKEKICAPKTLYKIESGITVDNDCYYYRLSEKLNKILIFDEKLFLELDHYRDTLTELLIDYSYTKLMNFKKELLDKLDAYKNVIYVAERLRLYVDIIVGISDKSSCSQSKNDFYFYIKDSLDEKDKMLILYYLFHSLCYFPGQLSNQIFVSIYQEAMSYKDNRLAFNFWLSVVFDTIKPLQFLKMLEEYKELYQDRFTKHEWYLYNDYHAYVYFNTEEYELCYQYLLKNAELIDSGLDYTENKVRNLNVKLAILAYNQDKYDEAIIHFEKCRVNNCLNIGNANIAFYIHSLEKTNQVDKVIEIINSYDINASTHDYEKKIIRYYRIKHINDLEVKERLKKREDFICEELIDVINRNGSMLKNLFKEELMSCVEQTTSYKKVYIFEKNTTE